MLGVILLFYLIVFQLDPIHRTTLNVLSILGTIASVFGLAIAYIQIIALKEISVVTQQTISDTKNKLMLGISISDVTEAISLVSEIDGFLGMQKYEIARHKIVNLKDKLIQFKSSAEFNVIVHENRIKEIVELLSTHINTLYNVVFGEIEDIKFDSGELNAQLQEIANYLTDFKNKIKYQIG